MRSRALGIGLVLLGVALFALTILLAFTLYAFVSALLGVMAVAFGVVFLAGHAHPDEENVRAGGSGAQ